MIRDKSKKNQLKEKEMLNTEEEKDLALTKEELEGVAGAGRPGKHKPPHNN